MTDTSEGDYGGYGGTDYGGLAEGIYGDASGSFESAVDTGAIETATVVADTQAGGPMGVLAVVQLVSGAAKAAEFLTDAFDYLFGNGDEDSSPVTDVSPPAMGDYFDAPYSEAADLNLGPGSEVATVGAVGFPSVPRRTVPAAPIYNYVPTLQGVSAMSYVDDYSSDWGLGGIGDFLGEVAGIASSIGSIFNGPQQTRPYYGYGSVGSVEDEYLYGQAGAIVPLARTLYRVIAAKLKARGVTWAQAGALLRSVGLGAGGAALGLTLEEAAHIIMKGSRRRRGRGISAADLRRTRSTIRKIDTTRKSFAALCRRR